MNLAQIEEKSKRQKSKWGKIPHIHTTQDTQALPLAYRTKEAQLPLAWGRLSLAGAKLTEPTKLNENQGIPTTKHNLLSFDKETDCAAQKYIGILDLATRGQRDFSGLRDQKKILHLQISKFLGEREKGI